jgi:hypothetical protein
MRYSWRRVNQIGAGLLAFFGKHSLYVRIGFHFLTFTPQPYVLTPPLR